MLGDFVMYMMIILLLAMVVGFFVPPAGAAILVIGILSSVFGAFAEFSLGPVIFKMCLAVGVLAMLLWFFCIVRKAKKDVQNERMGTFFNVAAVAAKSVLFTIYELVTMGFSGSYGSDVALPFPFNYIDRMQPIKGLGVLFLLGVVFGVGTEILKMYIVKKVQDRELDK